ncbi:hypothetical protein V8F20_012160, partial [Naviculisporaceae sp. PSN 640]
PPPTVEPVGIGFAQPIFIVAPIAIVVSTAFVVMRIWSRAFILRVFALEDWFLILGWICATAVSVNNIVLTQHGLGHVFSTLPPNMKIDYLKISLANNIVYAIALTSVKISILCLYLRALRYDYIHVATKVMFVIVVITHLWIIASLFTVCIPLRAVWNLALRKKSYCHSFDVYWSHSGINIGTDFLIFALPLFVLRKLQVPPRQKIALGFVFALAFRYYRTDSFHSVCIVSLARTLQFVRGITMGDRDTINIACWTIVEPSLAVICACLTTIKPLVSKLFPKLLSGSNDSTSYGPNQTPEGAGGEIGLETIGRRALGRRKR